VRVAHRLREAQHRLLRHRHRGAEHRRRPVGLTTLAEIDGRFYNSRLVRRVTGPALAAAVEFVIAEGEFVQRGIPLAQLDGQNFDLRVVCVYGKPVATIFGSARTR
jgi:hypothetical protein